MLEWIAGALLLIVLIFIALSYLGLIDEIDWVRGLISFVAGALTLLGAGFVALARLLVRGSRPPPDAAPAREVSSDAAVRAPPEPRRRGPARGTRSRPD